jgi:hypothetical protein
MHQRFITFHRRLFVSVPFQAVTSIPEVCYFRWRLRYCSPTEEPQTCIEDFVSAHCLYLLSIPFQALTSIKVGYFEWRRLIAVAPRSHIQSSMLFISNHSLLCRSRFKRFLHRGQILSAYSQRRERGGSVETSVTTYL